MVTKDALHADALKELPSANNAGGLLLDRVSVPGGCLS